MRKTIHPYEILLTVDTHEGSNYINESATLKGQERDLKTAIKGVPDSIINLYLFDVPTGTTENVTEDTATLWLEDYTGTPDDEDQPEYVKESEVFDTWAENWRVENGPAERRGQYSTLDKRTQGLTS